ncbi:MAG: glycerol-3-phosphate 1-O-acyltransferase PlsY [Alphaproteobacteria bacterium]
MIEAAIGGYLLGSIPFGLVLTRLAGLGDIREIGSGNIGATNVLRTGNKALAAATLLLDSGKGAAAALIFTHFVADSGSPAGLIAGGMAIVGHNFPVWLKFKGGKGVATTLGVLLAVSWPVGLAACVTWALAAFVFRYSSLAALMALSLAPVYGVLLADMRVALLAAMLALLAIWRHADNIRRLLNGEESKIGNKKS